MNELIQQVINWADEKGILAKSTPEKQFLKFMSELGEFCDELAKENYDAAKMELGDVIVTIILYFELSGNKFRIDSLATGSTGRTGRINRIICDLPTEAYQLSFNYLSDSLMSLTKAIDSTPEECLQLAFDKISKRQGSMVNGVFVKQ